MTARDCFNRENGLYALASEREDRAAEAYIFGDEKRSAEYRSLANFLIARSNHFGELGLAKLH